MSLTEEGRIVTGVASRLFEAIKRETFDLVEQGGWPGGDWAGIEDAGLPLAFVSEASGGYGLPLFDGLTLIRLAGEFALPLPLPETMIANWMLAQSGFEASTQAMTFGVGSLTLRKVGGHWTAGGQLVRTPWARHCGIAALASFDGRPHLVRLPKAPGDVTSGTNVAGEPRDSVFINLSLPEDAVRPTVFDPAQIRLLGAAMRTLQIAGAMEKVLDMTTGYVRERSQFGRSLGAFQAVQHQIAILASETAAARVASDLAIDGVVGGLEPRSIAAGKARAGEAGGTAASIAHQLHGAMGFTREYNLQLFVRRLWSWRDEFGGEAEWNSFLGRALAGAKSGQLWAQLTTI